MKSVIFPDRQEWGDGLAGLEGDTMHDSAYVRIIESCGVAYFHRNPIVKYLFRKRLSVAFEMLAGSQYDRILDAGCGVGFFLPALSSIARKVSGVDYHREAIEMSQRLVDHRALRTVDLVTGDILKLPYDDASFDGVVSLSVFEHITHLDEACRELKRVARPEAVFVIGYPMESSFGLFPLLEWLDHLTGFRKHQQRVGVVMQNADTAVADVTGHVSHWRAIDEALERHFVVEKKRYISLIPGIARLYAFRKLRNKY